ncbi:MAG: tryptophan--tRNA ligase [Miltoncostaeaceae bacterium]
MGDGSTDRIALTGIKPTGSPTLGNYLGMIRPALALVERYRPLYFIADYHALTTVRDGHELRSLTRELAATWLALGLDTERGLLYRQSDVPEIFEITWILSCFAPKGLLNRAHAYKAAVDANEEAERTPDDGVSMGLFNYPVLMAADILSFDADVVPVGLDQKQHVEIARDIADALNTAYGEVLRLPEPLIDPNVQTIPGTDGRKMSKSYGNTLPLFEEPKRLTKQVKRIVTDSRRPEDPKDPDTDTVFLIYRAVAPAADAAALRERYLAGGVGYGEVKEDLAARLVAEFAEPRERYLELIEDRDMLDGVLADGAARARALAAPVLDRLRRAVGVA